MTDQRNVGLPVADVVSFKPEQSFKKPEYCSGAATFEEQPANANRPVSTATLKKV